MGHKYVKEEDTFSTSQNGTVPKPTAQEVADNKFLRADGTWKTGGGGGGSSVEFTQTLTSGIESGTLTIDGDDIKIYAPYPFIYSTSEQRIGKWLDGKPLYQISVPFSTNANQITSVDISGLNIDTPVNMELNAVRCERNGTDWSTSAYYWSSGDGISAYIQSNKSTLIVRSQSSYPRGPGYATIRYTKTTDII